MSSEEEDYMSDAFLIKCGDARPGLAPKHKQKQYEQQKKEKEANVRSKTLPRKQLEAQQLQEGLSTSISQNNKGFALLQKMGYKPGSGIGKSGEGRKEPIAFEVKAGRSGLGKDSEMKRKSNEMNNMRVMMLAKRKKLRQEETESFQSRLRDKFNDKSQEKDLRIAQKACMQLDQNAGLTEPPEPFFWPPNSLQTASSTDQNEETETEYSRLHPGGYNQHPYDSSDDDDLCDNDDVEESPAYLDFTTYERTEIVTRYLRNVYKYCIWCGTSYEDEKELQDSCPGNSADAHEN